jgi:hypothetical protein
VAPSPKLNPEFGVTAILATLLKVTVAVVVALAVPDAAVMVAVPAEIPFRAPPVLIVATLVLELDQHTVVPVQLVPPVSVRGLPLLSVPAAVSDVVNPTLTLGSGGSIVMVETVGFTKKPVQLMVRPRVTRAANDPARRSLCLFNDIILRLLRARLLGSDLTLADAKHVASYFSTILSQPQGGCKKL